ncbi:hypothetical protein A9Q84_21670 [Halobacteriovorax marinus]|uniref:Uncharacterized protein n=1 Tax=Halobacteriovorax marinus TaxID=97084 RepID=A0A1Y5F1U9_9BACT|nr:hypothetical protein A9Q84_21670 [Halobacteriovorax marinus]
MKTLITISILFSFGTSANVGEGDTSCIKNQSTQARNTGKSKATKGETVTASKEASKSTQVGK